MEAVSLKVKTQSDVDAARAVLRELMNKAKADDGVKLRAAELLLIYSQTFTE